MEQWNTRKRSYRRLGVNDYIEIREYPPQRRTVSIGRKMFSLQFPYTIFVGVWDCWDDWDECFEEVSLSVGFAKKRITSMYDVIYHPVLPHIGAGNGLRMCMSGRSYQSQDLGDLVKDYWCSRFAQFASGHCSHGSRQALSANFGRLASWQKLNLDQVVEQLCYGPRLFKSFVSDAVQGYHYEGAATIKGIKFLKSIRKTKNQTDKRYMKKAGLTSSGDCTIDALVDDDMF